MIIKSSIEILQTPDKFLSPTEREFKQYCELELSRGKPLDLFYETIEKTMIKHDIILFEMSINPANRRR
jgi:hypothetical protein